VARRKRIVFFTWRWVLRRFGNVVAELDRRGHEVVIAFPRGLQRSLPEGIHGLPHVSRAVYDEVSDPELGRALALLRHARDYAWYLSPDQAVAKHNRRRALGYLVRSASGGTLEADPSWPDPVLSLDEEVRTALAGALDVLERQLPPDPGVVAFMRRERPDAVLVSPLLHQRLHQTEIVKAARTLGIPSGFLVYSLDNLSNKSRIHVPPDRTFVWNEFQTREAVDLHGIDPAAVVVTGANRWDPFLAMQPSVDRAKFCRRHGFDLDRPVVLYVASSVGICPDETLVVDRWLDAVRRAPAPLGEANLLIRPHPGSGKYGRLWSEWATGHKRVAITQDPRPADQGLYDSLSHAAAVVGLNTSAEVEASMLETPVYTFSAGDLAPGQEGTRHFYYLLEGHGGVVTHSETLEEHVQALANGVAGEVDRAAMRAFWERWVRPRGFDRPVAPILADEILELAASAPRVRPLLRYARARLEGAPRAPLGRLRALIGTR
jgi:hypothetical protein